MDFNHLIGRGDAQASTSRGILNEIRFIQPRSLSEAEDTNL